MKKLLLLLSLLLLSSPICTAPSISYAQQTYWAKINKANVSLYSDLHLQTSLFIIPQSYFVKLTDQQNDVYKAQYKDVTGYVKKEDVIPMEGTPASPYFYTSFRTFIPSGIGIYCSPQINDELKIANVPYLFEKLEYYGSIEGQTAIPDKSNVWHYCKFEDKFGYVYSSFCDKLSSPPINNEAFQVIDNPSFNTASGQVPLSSTAMTFIIIAVSLPCLIVLYLLMKPNLLTKALPQEKAKYKARKRRDYFEFDQSDLN